MHIKIQVFLPLFLPFLLVASQYVLSSQVYAQMQKDNSTMMQTTATPPIQSPSPTNTSMAMTPTGENMIGSGSAMAITPTLSMQDQQAITNGGNVFTLFKNGQINCRSLQNDDLERIGEYIMNQQMGETIHIQTNQMIAQMMGNNGEIQVHILIGRNATGCPQTTPTSQPVNTKMNNNFSAVMGVSGIKAIAGWAVAAILLLIDVIVAIGWVLKRKVKKNSESTPPVQPLQPTQTPLT